MADEVRIIIEFERYISDEINKPREAFGGAAMCPYAADATITYVIVDFWSTYICQLVSEWLDSIQLSDVLIIIHNGRCVTNNELQGLCNLIEYEFDYKLEVFAGHPLSEHKVRGVLTRNDPFCNLQINRKADLARARDELHSEGYYNG